MAIFIVVRYLLLQLSHKAQEIKGKENYFHILPNLSSGHYKFLISTTVETGETLMIINFMKTDINSHSV